MRQLWAVTAISLLLVLPTLAWAVEPEPDAEVDAAMEAGDLEPQSPSTNPQNNANSMKLW